MRRFALLTSTILAWHGAHAAVPAGAPNVPDLLNGYATRPSWDVAGVDYHVGVPDGITLKDPTAAALPSGCSYASNTVTCNGNTQLSGYDFSLHGTQLVVNGSGSVSGNKFAMTSCQDPLINLSVSGSLAFSVNDVAGAGSKCSSLPWGTLVNSTLSAGAKLTVEQNNITNIPQDAIDVRGPNSSAASLAVRNNLFNGQGWTGHPDGIQTNGGNFDQIDVSSNTYYTANNSVAGTQPLHIEAQLGSAIGDVTEQNNTVLTPGDCQKGGKYGVSSSCVANFPIACKQDGSGNSIAKFTADDNYIDWSGAIAPTSNNYGCTNTSWTGNVDLTTGRALNADGSLGSQDIVPASYTPPSGTTATPQKSSPAGGPAPGQGTGTGQTAGNGATPTDSCIQATPKYAASAGGFGVIDGKWYSPNGTEWKPQGINVMEGQNPSAADILAKFPGTNFVRYAVYDFADPSQLQTIVNDYTSHGIFVELENHSSSDSSNRGGGQGTIFSGSTLQKDLAWYAAIGKAFANNPYVGAGSTNEPSEINPTTGQTDPAALSDWQLAEYNAYRQAGNNNPFWLQMNGWDDPNSFGQGYRASDYAKMTNAAWDMHIYPWLFDQGASVDANVAKINQFVATAQKITSADGIMPVNFLEGGNSTTGQAIDPNGDTTVAAITKSNYGYAAWAWGSGGPGDGLLNNSTQYPAMVAAYIATSGSNGCPQSPVVTEPTNVHGTLTASEAEQIKQAADNLTVAQLAELAGQGETADGQSIAAVAQLANTGGSGVDQGGVLPTDPTTTSVLAQNQGTEVPVLEQPRTTNSPSGTMPTPDPVSTYGTINVSGDYGATAASNSNNSGSISGTGNVVAATGGIQILTITGPGNNITLGPYNDTVTVKSPGNTIDMGSGNDTLTLAYKGEPTNARINADAAALPPLADAGNVILLPAPGTGMLTVNGTLAQNDRIDLSRALAGTTWNHQASTMWQYVDAAASAQGCTISVGGKVIAILPNGSPKGDIGSFVTAH